MVRKIKSGTVESINLESSTSVGSGPIKITNGQREIASPERQQRDGPSDRPSQFDESVGDLARARFSIARRRCLVRNTNLSFDGRSKTRFPRSETGRLPLLHSPIQDTEPEIGHGSLCFSLSLYPRVLFPPRDRRGKPRGESTESNGSSFVEAPTEGKTKRWTKEEEEEEEGEEEAEEEEEEEKEEEGNSSARPLERAKLELVEEGDLEEEEEEEEVEVKEEEADGKDEEGVGAITK
ncbi:hypothetical protein V1478_006655 [Vespula squamosa]|uniref:Uncharacterized protein n=1 Tax=Vespula squamosa TaxID=30214 RepID=A0ABD2B8H1_VESSQ